MFSDDTHFDITSRATERVIRASDERYHEDCIQYKKRGKGAVASAWAIVGYGWKSPLVFYNSNDTITAKEELDLVEMLASEDQPAIIKPDEASERRIVGEPAPSTCLHKCKSKDQCKHPCCKPNYELYKHGDNLTMVQYVVWILRAIVEPVIDQHSSERTQFLLLEDNDGSHGTRSTDNVVTRFKQYLTGKYHFDYVANSPQSPDLNVIENCWRKLKQRLKRRRCKTAEDLKAAAIEIWNREIDQGWINGLIESTPDRYHMVYERRGLHTKW